MDSPACHPSHCVQQHRKEVAAGPDKHEPMPDEMAVADFLVQHEKGDTERISQARTGRFASSVIVIVGKGGE